MTPTMTEAPARPICRHCPREADLLVARRVTSDGLPVCVCVEHYEQHYERLEARHR